jgi:hypothetical protein
MPMAPAVMEPWDMLMSEVKCHAQLWSVVIQVKLSQFLLLMRPYIENVYICSFAYHSEEKRYTYSTPEYIS